MSFKYKIIIMFIFVLVGTAGIKYLEENIKSEDSDISSGSKSIILMKEAVLTQDNGWLKAKTCMQEKQSGRMKMKDILAFTRGKNGTEYTVVADEGEKSTQKQQVILEGNVEVNSEKGIKIFTDRMIYNLKKKDIHCPGSIRIIEGNTVTTGNCLHYDTEKDSGQLVGNVKVIIGRKQQ